ncbi:MAG: hypothetical protein WC516_03125 [Patescibacteria group bacterium]
MVRLFKQLHLWLERRPKLAGTALFFLSIFYFSILQWSKGFGDPDSFYHIKISQLIVKQGIIFDFPYLQFTVLKNGFIDHHFLYHLLMMPFVTLLPALIGAKIFQVILAAVCILVFFYLLKKFAVKGAFWYTFFLFFCYPFIFRINLVKAPALSVIFLLLAILFIFRKKYWKLGILSFLYVWTYDGWFILAIMAIVYAVADSWDFWLKSDGNSRSKLRPSFLAKVIKDRLFKDKANLKLIASVALGLLLGIIINPYFPKNLGFYFVHIVQIGLVNFQTHIGVGAEWYPYSWSQFFRATGASLLLLVPALSLFLYYRKKMNAEVKFFLLMAGLFLLATIKAKRNIEYLIPFFNLTAVWIYLTVERLPEFAGDFRTFRQSLNNFLGRDKRMRWLLGLAVIVGIINYQVYIVDTARTSLSLLKFDKLEKVSQYFQGHSRPKAMVFHSDWSTFPLLFYHNSSNYYIVGLDPTFMYLYDKDKYQKWLDITRGERADQLYDIIKNQFGSSYVLVEKNNEKMSNNLKNNFYFKNIYQDNEATLYQVN